jgi:hypothetical protein
MADIDRIKALIQLAGSPNENEARSAAVMACKLIRDGKVVLTNEDDPRIIPTTFVDVPMRQGNLSQDELLDELRGMGVKVGRGRQGR